MSVVGLFAGIGGFELALSRRGIDTVLLVENDLAAATVLKARFPSVEFHDDVTTLRDLPAQTSIVTAGFPCQNLSMAGDKSGITGPKSGAVQKLFELLERSRVPTVLLENVYFMLQLDGGKAMHWLVEQFERLGYLWAYRVLDTIAFGLPQRRRRVYFVASRDLDPRRVLFADEVPSPEVHEASLVHPLGFYWTEGRSGLGLTVDAIPPLKVGSGWGIPSAPAVFFPDGEVLMPSVEACEALQGFPFGWTALPNGSIAHGKKRWQLVGNAVSVPVVEWVVDRLYSLGDVLDFETTAMNTESRWPGAAWNVGKGPIAVKASTSPIWRTKSSISDFRDASWRRLSERALSGFISRAVDGGLKMPEGFLDALRAAPRRET